MRTAKSDVGALNRNNQRLVAKTDSPGNDHMQYVWIVQCERPVLDGSLCAEKYGANGSDFFQRKCPRCQAGRPGLSIEGANEVSPARQQFLKQTLAKSETFGRRVALPTAVSAIYRAVEELEQRYPGRKFTPDGHLVGSIGEVVAAEALGLTLYPGSHPTHDAYDSNGDVQIKMTGGHSVSLYSNCDRLVVLRVLSPEEAEVVYDGAGQPVWDLCGKLQKNGQRSVRLSRLRQLNGS